MRIVFCSLILTVFALAGASPAEGQQLYRWVDADGVTHYSDSAPEGVKFETRMVQRTGNLATSTTETNPEPRPNPETEAILNAAAALRPPDPERENKCRQARQNLALLNGGDDLVMDLDGDGEAEPLDAAARADQITQTNGQIRAFCD